MMNRFDTFLMLSIHILLPNHTNFKKTLGKFENLVFVIMSTRENKRLIAKKKKKQTPAVKFLDLIFRNNFFVFNFSKMCCDEKYSGTSPPTSPNGSSILDVAGSSVLRCTL